jgi:SH2 domain-containing protein 4A
MQEVRSSQVKRQKEEEKKMESLYAEAKKKADRHAGEKKETVRLARERASSEGSLRESKTVAALEEKRKTMLELSSVESGNPAARPSRPPDEAAVVAWWKSEEGPRGVGRSATDQLEKWFHGPISRQASEKLLEGQGNGAFLIRLSTRIWGYTLSFNDTDKAKHFLVDAADGQYSVFGAQTRSHTSLNTMVQFHNTIPVSKNGTKLTKPVGDDGGNTASLTPLL